ncbi:MAG: hypothetical protein P8Z38_00920 [Robiginitalea sp.]
MKPPQHTSLYALDNAQLINLVRRHRFFGFSVETRDKARRILEKRGLDEDILRRIGYLKEDRFDEALKYYLSFKRLSRIAFLLYGVFLLFIITSYFVEPNWIVSSLLLGIFTGLVGVVVLSLINQLRFYRVLGKSFTDGSPLVFFFLGMPLYFLMYFRFKARMEEHLNRLA